MKIEFNTSFLSRTQNSILSAAFVISAATAFNAILGFVKGRLLANYFGVSTDLAIFYTADRIPNLIYSIIIVGAISTIFIPIFADLLKKDDKNAFSSASSIVNATLILFFVIGLGAFIGSFQIIKLLSLGKFSEEEMTLGTNLMQIMLLAQLILVAGSLTTSILQSFKYFLVPALAPVFYNVGMILGIVFLSEKFGIYGPTYGVVLGSILHFGIQIPLLLKTGFKYKLSLNLADKGIVQMMKLVPPRIGSVFLANAIGTVNNSLAILVSTSSVVYLKFAYQLQTFPINLFGLAIASASLPTLSMENKDNFKKTFLTSLHQTMFLVLPVSVILLVLRIPVVRIVYGVSNFPWEATVKTSYVLAFFSISIFAQSANYLLTRAFYALKDTVTPVLVSLCTMTLNIGLSVLFVVYLKMGVWAVALSLSITSILDSLIFLTLLNKRVGGFGLDNLLKPFTKISYASLIMGFALYIPLKLMDQYIFDTTKTINLLAVTAIAGTIGMSVYLVLTKLFNVEEIELFYKILRKLKIQKPDLDQTPPEEVIS